MTWVKICGITNLDDAKAAIDAGADAIGFVFYEKSPRNVDEHTVSTIVARLPRSVDIEKVGVFVGDDVERMQRIAESTGLTAIQMHGSLPVKRVPVDKFRIFIAVRMDDLSAMGSESLESALGRADAVFLDSGTTSIPGGTGAVFDWQASVPAVTRVKKAVKVVVAGGLNPTNVTEAIRILEPWGVDVSTGVEARPGKKDHEKLRAFVATVREAGKIS